MTTPASGRFLEGTQGRILSLLQDEPRTVEDLARALELTPNAIRAQLATLERDGLAQVEGRRPSGRKPALVYGLTRNAGVLLSRAYLPLLQHLLAELDQRLAPAERVTVMREVGRRIAAALPRARGSRRERAEAAVRAIEALGGRARVGQRGRHTALLGSGCPLAELVATYPEVCRAVETVVGEVMGEPVHESCDRGAKPSCVFVVG